MALYSMECECGNKKRILASEPKCVCSRCGKNMHRAGTGPSSRVIEVRDNGLMHKKVEQLADIQDLVKERSTKNE